MKPERLLLENNVHFSTLYTDKFKTEQLTLYLVMPLENEVEASRLALLPRVLRRGSRDYPKTALLLRRLEELYSTDLSAGAFKLGERHVLFFSVNTLRREFLPQGEDLLPEVTRLLLSLVFSPYVDSTTGVFSDEYVEGEKTNACRAIASLQNNKSTLATLRCLSLMCRGETYAVHEWGTEAETAKITPASLFDTYRRVLSEASFEIYYAGTADPTPIKEAITRELSLLRRHPLPLPPTAVVRSAGKKRRFTEKAMAVQGKLCMGFRTGITMTDDDAAAFYLFHAIYSQFPSSKLFMNVRERLSLCYSCSSSAELSKGILLVKAGIDNNKKHKAVREILRQLRRMRAGKFTEEEIRLAKEMLAFSIRSLEDEPAAVRRWYLGRSLLGLTQTPEELWEAIRRVTPRDIVRVAKRISLDTVYFLRGSEAAGEEADDE
ncbi:MAG: insulinase family protein [Clostridia bacterium]|nr:insulinase family protein [Clostridia bacterium]